MSLFGRSAAPRSDWTEIPVPPRSNNRRPSSQDAWTYKNATGESYRIPLNFSDVTDASFAAQYEQAYVDISEKFTGLAQHLAQRGLVSLARQTRLPEAHFVVYDKSLTVYFNAGMGYIKGPHVRVEKDRARFSDASTASPAMVFVDAYLRGRGNSPDTFIISTYSLDSLDLNILRYAAGKACGFTKFKGFNVSNAEHAEQVSGFIGRTYQNGATQEGIFTLMRWWLDGGWNNANPLHGS